MGVSLDPGLHSKLLLLSSDKALLTPRNVLPALKEIRAGQVTMWRENKVLRPHSG